MGYRSEVVLVVGKEVMPQFMVTMAKSIEARALCFGDHDKMIKDYEEEGNILFAWNGIKWYEGYEAIDALTDFMDWCDSESVPHPDPEDGGTVDGDECYRFCRVGEEEDDNVTRGSAFWDVGISRSIEF